MKNYDETQLENCLARVQEAKEQIEIVKQVLVDFGCEWDDDLLIKTSAGRQSECDSIALVLDVIESKIEEDILEIL